MSEFQLYVSFSKDFYIPISENVISYIEDKVVKELLYEGLASAGSRQGIVFTIHVSDSNYPNSPKDIVLWDKKGANNKLYGAVCSRDNINESRKQNEELINLIIHCVELFIEKYYKKIIRKQIERFKRTVDFQYLYQIPFPSEVPSESFISDDVHIPPPRY
ncbi:MAG: hypothetical protein JST26_12910 [Bacteroidetes bacterium]|nr:hypothetical protein [Bacteroidota bacterium]